VTQLAPQQPDDEGTLVARARTQLAADVTPAEVFLGFVLDDVEYPQAAIAVCVAAGASKAEAHERLQDFGGLWDELQPGDEADAAEVLQTLGYFEPNAVLNPREQVVASALRDAIGAFGGIPSGYAAGLWRQLRTGRLATVFVGLEKLGGGRPSDERAFWASMRAAADLLDTDQGEDGLREAIRRCRERGADPAGG
jgi:hypothetical protein